MSKTLTKDTCKLEAIQKILDAESFLLLTNQDGRLEAPVMLKPLSEYDAAVNVDFTTSKKAGKWW